MVNNRAIKQDQQSPKFELQKCRVLSGKRLTIVHKVKKDDGSYKVTRKNFKNRSIKSVVEEVQMQLKNYADIRQMQNTMELKSPSPNRTAIASCTRIDVTSMSDFQPTDKKSRVNKDLDST